MGQPDCFGSAVRGLDARRGEGKKQQGLLENLANGGAGGFPRNPPR